MANTDEVAKVKLIMGIQGDDKDTLVSFALDNAKELILNYCHLDMIPTGLETTHLRMAIDIYREEGLGTEDSPNTVTGISIGDTKTTFGTLDEHYTTSLLKDYRKSLNAYRKVAFK